MIIKSFEEALNAALNMERYGGSFAYHIGKAYIHADGTNKVKLIEAFQAEFQRFYNWGNK